MACQKDRFTTKPQLKFIKASSYDVQKGQALKLDLELTDAEGDVQDTLFIRREVKNYGAVNQTFTYMLSSSVPTQHNLKATVQVCFTINELVGECPVYSAASPQNRDTTTFKFWIRDKAGNFSDTVSTDKEVVIKN